jgi:hypothetical protein
MQPIIFIPVVDYYSPNKSNIQYIDLRNIYTYRHYDNCFNFVSNNGIEYKLCKKDNLQKYNELTKILNFK